MAQGQAQQIAIRLDNAAAIRGGRLVLERFSLQAHAGDIIWLRGPNGSGKSTLLRLIGGLLPMAGGQRKVSGRIALADDNGPLEGNLPLEKALDFWARLDGTPGDQKQAAMTAFDLSGLSELPVSYLSAGQRKRAELARMISSGADVCLLDEPYNGLDTANSNALDNLLTKHAKDGGIAIIAAHQDPSFEVTQTVTLGSARQEGQHERL